MRVASAFLSLVELGNRGEEPGARQAADYASLSVTMPDLFAAEVDTTGPVMMLILPEGCPLLMATEFLGWTAAAAAPDGAPSAFLSLVEPTTIPFLLLSV